MSNVKYTYEIQLKIEEMKRKLKIKDENAIIVDYCLGCKKKFKNYRGEIQTIDSISVYIDSVTGERYLYFLCDKCAVKLMNPYSKNEFQNLDNNISKEIQMFNMEKLKRLEY